MSGRMIELLSAGEFRSGFYTVEWQATDQAAGIYIIGLEVDGLTQCKRLVYLP